MLSTSASKRYPVELRERAVRMVTEVRDDHESEWAAMARVTELLGVGRPRRSVSGSGRPRSMSALVRVSRLRTRRR